MNLMLIVLRRGVHTRNYRSLVAIVSAALLVGSCSPLPPNADSSTVLRDAASIPLDGEPHAIQGNVVALGALEAGDAIRLRVDGEVVESFLLLIPDEQVDDAGLLAGGGPGGTFVDYAVQISSEYFLFVQYDPSTPQAQQQADIEVERLSDSIAAPSRQLVHVAFMDGFLTEPGLWDPTDGTPEDQEFLASISDVVRVEIVRKLQELFRDTPIEIIDSLPLDGDEPISQVTFSPERVLADQDDISDAALPQPDPAHPECQVRVLFGEVLPRGTLLDRGNRVPDDGAVVYVGSFQGRGQACWTSVVGSVNNLVLALAQTAAHEIGHLVGLHHVEQIDIMNRSATLAFFRDLELARGQIQIDRLIDGVVVAEVLPSVVQDPEVYFRAVFSGGD